MKLTSYSNYALRSLQLAALKSPDLVRVDDVAKVHNLSRPHIMKVVDELGKTGYLETVRGRGGGFRLARDPKEIVVGDVVRITKGPLDVVECFDPQKNTCPLIGICFLTKKMQEATAAFMAVLGDLTIAYIASNHGQLMDRIAHLEFLISDNHKPVRQPERLPHDDRHVKMHFPGTPLLFTRVAHRSVPPNPKHLKTTDSGHFHSQDHAAHSI